MYKSFAIILLSTFVFTMCQKEKEATDKTPLLEVCGQVLYEENLPLNLAENLSPEDSAVMMDAYIKRWVTDAVMYDYAKRNVQNPEEISQLVEEYRRLLTVQHYQQMLIDQRLPQPTQVQIAEYYENHSSDYLLRGNIVRGVLVKIPTSVSKKNNAKKWVNEGTPETYEKLEHYCVANGCTLDYFENKWIYVKDLQTKLPSYVTEEQVLATKNGCAELTDSAFVYMLKVTDCRSAGSPEPIDFASDKIRNVLLNKGKIEFIHDFEEDLYKHAQKEITYYDKKDSISVNR